MKANYQCVTTVQGIRDYLGDAEIIAFDFETAPDESHRAEEKAALDPARAHIVGCAFSTLERTGRRLVRTAAVCISCAKAMCSL